MVDIKKLPFYVINLDKSKDRWKTISDSFKKEGLEKNLHRFPAVYGKELPIEKLRNEGRILIPKRDRAAKPGGIGNYFSIFRLFYEAVFNWKHDYICLLEDDMLLVEGFKEKLQVCLDQVEKVDKNWSILYLASGERQKNAKIIEKNLKVRIPFQNPKSKNVFGNVGFVITKKAMLTLLEYSCPIREASDIFIIGMGKNVFYKNPNYPKILDYYTCYPYLLKDTEHQTESTIS